MNMNSAEAGSQLPGEAELMKHITHVTPTDEFTFQCVGCADCCKNVEAAVAVEALDLFHLSSHLKQSGSAIWKMEDVLLEYTELYPLTEFWYPMFFLKTKEPNATCIFLQSGRCSIHSAKPRTCRMYPLTANPLAGGADFQYYIITERAFHYTGPRLRVGDWMAENLTTEDREFSKADLPAALLLGQVMKRKKESGVDVDQMLHAIIYFKYLNYDVSKPFMPQYLSNIDALMRVLAQMS